MDRADPGHLLTPAPAVDALAPDAMARAAAAAAEKKAHDAPARQFVLGILGGAYVALGAMFATVAIAGAADHLPWGLSRVVMGVAFSMGLMLVVVTGARLFTSDSLMVLPWTRGRLTLAEMLRGWALSWSGNLVGALGTAALCFVGGQYLAGHGEVGASALYLAASKAGLPPLRAFALGILCNVLVCLAVWVAAAGRSVADKVLAMLLPVSAFVAAGFEHCVANMYFVPYGLLVEHFAPASFWAEPALQGHVGTPIPAGQFLVNLGVVTAGNALGGALFVGAMYAWLNRRDAPAAAPGRIKT